MPQAEVPEGMVNLAQALVETPHLRAWFFSFEDLPESFRRAAFSEMAAEMRDAGEDIGLSDAIAALIHPQIYAAVLAAVRERVSETTPIT